MPIYRKPDLSIAGIKFDTTVILYDDVPAVEGNHLRWNFNPEMGFPKDGFTLSRAVWNPQASNFTLTHVHSYGISSLRFDWSVRINLPASTAEALDRVRMRLSPDVLHYRFGSAADELLQLVRQLRAASGPDYLKFISPSSGSDVLGELRIMDLLFLASIDPYLARMIGLYYIDQEANPSTSYLYLLKGHWGDTLFPLISVTFEALVIPVQYQTLQFGAVKVISSGRQIGVPTLDGNDLMDKHLLVQGVMNPAIRMHFDFPVEEVILHYRLIARDGATITSPSWGIRADGTLISPIVSGASRLHIHRPSSAFERIEFTLVEGVSWYIFKIEYRKKENAIGDLHSYYLHNPAYQVPVTTPSIASLKAEKMTALLNESGRIDNQMSQVSISANIFEPEIEAIDSIDTTDASLRTVPPLGRPVRMLFGTSKTSSATPAKIINEINGSIYPALNRSHANAAVLPELLGYWAFNGSYENIKNGLVPTVLGQPGFTKDHFRNSDRFSLSLHGNNAIILSRQDYLKSLGSEFTLEVSVNINPNNESIATLIGNNRTAGFWLGLVKQSDGNYKLKFAINNTEYNASTPLPSGRWIRLSACYSGRDVRFSYFGYSFSSAEDAVPSVLGEVQVPEGYITIGADNGSTSAALIQPYRGLLADVCIWQRVIHPSESVALLQRHGNFLSQQQGIAELIFHEPMCYEVSTSRSPVLIEQTTASKALGKSFSIFLFTKPFASNETFTTLLGNNYRERFWIGLRQSGTTAFIVRVWVNAVVFESVRTISADSWSHVGLSYNGAALKIFINGIQDISHAASLGPLRKSTLALGVGSDTGTSVVSEQYRYNGFIQGIQLWRKEININEWKEKVSAIQHIDKHIPNGLHYYYVKGIDLFGRTSPWSPPKKVKTKATPDYQPPVNVHGSFKPLGGILTHVVEDENDRFILDTDILYSTAIASRISGYDVIVIRNVAGAENRVEQAYEIEQYINAEGLVRLQVRKPSFSQLLPERSDRIQIQIDFIFYLRWGLTGIQQLYFPELRSFRLFELNGYLNEVVGEVEFVTSHSEYRHTVIYKGELRVIENELPGEKCLIGPNMFTIESHGSGNRPAFNLHYSGMPAVKPRVNDTLRITIREGHSTFTNYQESRLWLSRTEIPVGNIEPITTTIHQTPTVEKIEDVTLDELKTAPPINASVFERQRLLLEKVDWLPLSGFYKVTISNFLQPPGYTEEKPEDYIPGALVFWDKQRGRNKWRNFYVLWHQWDTAQRVVLYVTPGEKNEDLPIIDVSEAHPLKLFLGKRYAYEGTLSAVPDLDGIPTLPYYLALASRDGGGTESTLSSRTTLVAVNRKRPGIGPRPIARIIKKADYYGNSPVGITWPPAGPQNQYKLYRANDSAIYTRDLEQRRTRQGYYKSLTPEGIFRDDPDFGDWLITTHPALSVSNLFAAPGTAIWEEMTPLWRRWADRFYPALTNDELDAIGTRAGNEKAFALITAKPLTDPAFTDSINGVVRNRYYYRLRLINNALAESSIWGLLSEAVTPPAVMPPAKPVFTKIQAANRQVTLYWALNRESNLKEYILYRSESKDSLEDLRWWSTEVDPRIVSHIPDPRIKTFSRSLELPSDIAMASILGVYRLDEFDMEANPISSQTQALNYYKIEESGVETLSTFIPSADGIAPHQIANLRRIADGVAMATVYAVDSGNSHALIFSHNQIPYVDTGLTGLTPYYYRLVAVNQSNFKATSNEIKSAMALDNTIPDPPVWIESTWVSVSPSGDTIPLEADGAHAVLLRWQTLPENIREIKVERMNDLGSWENVSGWLAPDTTSFLHPEANPEKEHHYRLVVKTFGNNQNIEFDEQIISKLLL